MPKTWKKWTDEEVDILSRMIDMGHGATTIGKRLGRTKNCVNLKRMEMGLPTFEQARNGMTFTEVANVCGVHKETVSVCWRNAGLAYKSRGGMCIVQEAALIDFMQKNPQRWEATKCDYYFFGRYEFFQKRIEAERAGQKFLRYRKWTPYEVSVAKMMFMRGDTYKAIGEKFGRNATSVVNLAQRKGWKRDVKKIPV